MSYFNIENYETVEDRLERFWKDHPTGRIATEMAFLNNDSTVVIFRAAIYYDIKETIPVAIGFAEETRGSSQVNKTSFVENCETSAIGRALANCGYAAKGSRPSRTEMEKVERGPQVVQMVQNTFGTPTKTPTKTPTRTMANPQATASSRQVGFLRSLLVERGVDDHDQRVIYCSHEIQRTISSLDGLTMGEASNLIEKVKSQQKIAVTETQVYEDETYAPEEAF